MILQMIGIDYEKADIDIRSLFSFHHHASQEGMQYLKDKYGFSGIIIISTCNRTEVYVSVPERIDHLFDMVCMLKNIKPDEYRNYVVERESKEAIHHLFQLTCGMKSKVFGEDQIITQVKTALSQARDIEVMDAYLEKIFQSAITAAKKVKAQVHLTAIKSSVIEEMKKSIYKEKESLQNCKCLVIGNGEIGRLAASAMVKERAKVTVTVRNYKTRQVEIPKGCKVLDYADRLNHIDEFEIIISATTSPHHTVKYEDCAELFLDGTHRILIDLAVPRDISSAFALMPNVTLYDIDSLGGISMTVADNEAMAQAMSIIKEYEDKLVENQQVKHFLTTIQTVGEMSGTMAYKRVKKQFDQLIDEEEQKQVEELVRQGTQKTVTSLLFDIKKQLPEEYWEACLQAMKTTIEEQIF